MAYDLSRCPQTEAECIEYVYTIYGRSIGQPANDWAAVMQNSNLPRNVYTPGKQADASWPNFGITQMWGSGGPRGRIFLPAVAADDQNWWTRQIQVIKDGPNGGLVWSWDWVSGNDYKPVTAATTAPGPVPPGTAGGIVVAQVQAMIDASVKPLEARIAALEAGGGQGIPYGAKVALRTNSGLLAGIKGGGPTEADAPIDWIGKTGDAHAWESLTIEKGE